MTSTEDAANIWPAGEQLTYTEVRERLNATDDDVIRLLHSLSCAKHKVLLKEPLNKVINKSDSFSLNVKFTDRMRRVKVRLRYVLSSSADAECIHYLAHSSAAVELQMMV